VSCRQKEKILLTFKMFEEESYAKEFLEGSLYCNSFQYFSENFELDDNAKRFDKLEGHKYVFHPDSSSIEMSFGEESIEFDKESGFLGMKIKLNEDLTKKMCCLYSFTSKTERFSRNNFRIDSRMLSMGKYVVIIARWDTFIERVKEALDKEKIEYSLGLVEYEDLESYSGSWGLFRKPLEYKHQSEFRIVFDDDSIEPKRLEIGRIDDIAKILKLEEFLSVEIGISEKEEGELLDKVSLREQIIYTED
jgi:hypothetical protein